MGYRAYPEYKVSGILWSPMLPRGWDEIAVKHGYEIQLGKMLQATSSGLDDIEVPYIKALHVNWSNIQTEDLPLMWASPCELKKYSVRNGDLLICEGGEVGRACILEELVDNAIIQNAIHRVRKGKLGELRYFQYLLQNIADAGWFSILCNKATIAHLTGEKLGAIKIPCPPHNQQLQISDFLDHKTRHIDRLIEKKQELIEKLQEERVTIITQAVTRGLTPDITLKDSGVEWLGKIPAHWLCAGFTKFISSQVDYRGKTPEKAQDGIFLITAKNIKDGTFNYELSREYVRGDQYDEIMSRGKPEVGDLLFTTEAPLGEVANIDRIDIALAQRVIKFRGETAQLDNYFARYWFMSSPFQDHLKSLATGSTALGIKASKLFELRIALPPLEEQIAIKNFLDKRLQALAATETKITEAIESLQEYRTALITAAVTGQIDVRDWQAPEPSKEPKLDKEVA